MKIKSLVLTGYKPFLHNGLKTVVVSDMDLITIIVGKNGIGKSSLLRQVTPFPATSTDFIKGGKKTIVIEHNNVEYTLISDFNPGIKTHSFLKDGQECNLSGNTDVQVSLVKQYFGYSLLIDKIMTCKYKFTEMTKSQRKELLYMTYPFQLDFVLEKYKDLMSKIKAGSAQLKLLNERKLKLSGDMLNPETKEEYEKQASALADQLNGIDKQLYEYEQHIKRSKDQLDLIRARIPAGMEIQDFKDKASLMSAKMNELYRNKKPLILQGSDIHDTIIREISEMSNIHQSMNNLQETGTSLKEEIEKYRAAANDDTEEQIKMCQSLIDAQKTTIANNPFDPSLPMLTADELERLKTALPYISKDLLYLKSLSCEMWTESQYEAHMTTIKNLEFQIAQENSFVARGEALLVELNRKYDKNNQYSYPAGCKQVCKLRENLENILNSIKVEIDKCKTDTETTNTLLKKHREEYDKVKDEVQQRNAARPILLRMERSITSKSWGDFVLGGVTLVEAVNRDVTEINNKLIKLAANTESSLVVKKAQEVLVGLEAKMTGLKSATKPMKELITKALVEKEVQLNKVNEQIQGYRDALSKLEDVHNTHASHEQLMKDILELQENFSWYSKGVMIKTDIEYTEKVMGELTRVKQELGSKLRDLEAILKDQNSYSIRLNEEILPNILKIETQNKKYQAVADSINPVTGLPSTAILKYCNALLHKANQYIGQIWSYDMALEYTPEDNTTGFDFTVPILLNNESRVSDCSIGSKGQRCIIDFAMTLAIATYLKLSTQYPLILDEFTDGLQPSHVLSQREFLEHFLHNGDVLQSFMVNHDQTVNSSFADAGVIELPNDEALPPTAKVISKIVMD